MQSVDRGEEIRSALDERDERAHRDRDTALGEIASDAVERSEERELVVHEPGEPVAGDLGTLVGSRQRPRGRALSTPAASAGGASDDTAALVLELVTRAQDSQRTRRLAASPDPRDAPRRREPKDMLVQLGVSQSAVPAL